MRFSTHTHVHKYDCRYHGKSQLDARRTMQRSHHERRNSISYDRAGKMRSDPQYGGKGDEHQCEYQQGLAVRESAQQTAECDGNPFSALKSKEYRENVAQHRRGKHHCGEKRRGFKVFPGSQERKNGEKALGKVAAKREDAAEEPTILKSVCRAGVFVLALKKDRGLIEQLRANARE